MPEGTQSIDGMEVLTRVVHGLIQKDVFALAEREYVEVMFLILSNSLAPADCINNRKRFLELDGCGLLVNCLKHRKLASSCALGVMKHLLLAEMDIIDSDSNSPNVKVKGEKDNQLTVAVAMINAGILAYIFPLLLGRGLPRLNVPEVSTDSTGAKNKRKGKI